MKAKQLWVGISATLFLLTPIGVNAQAAQQLIWEAPTSYVDGTPLTDLVSYTIHYGHTSRGAATNPTAFQYDFTATVAESQTTYPLASLPNFQGGQIYYFSVTAHDSSGNSSDFSNEVALDTTVPTVSLTAPADGALVLGTTVLVSAAASDDVGVVGVQFLLDGANLGSEATSAPYTITWDTTTATTGGHTIAARARDAAGNQTTTATVHVTVQRMDVDGDGLTDVDEAAYGTDPTVADTDGDGFTDGDEAAWWGADWNLNYDNDATANNLLDPDADNDGYGDGLERDYAFDPSDPTSKPLSLALPDADMDNVIGMSQDGLAAIVEIPAGALDADDTITVTVVDILDASGVLPGNVAGLIVDRIRARVFRPRDPDCRPNDHGRHIGQISNSKALFACHPPSCQPGSTSGAPPGGLRCVLIRPARRLRIACPRDRGHEVRPSGRTSTWLEARTPAPHKELRQRTRRTALAPSGSVPEAGGQPPAGDGVEGDARIWKRTGRHVMAAMIRKVPSRQRGQRSRSMENTRLSSRAQPQ